MNVAYHEEFIYAALDSMATDPDVTDEELTEVYISVGDGVKESASHLIARARVSEYAEQSDRLVGRG